MNGSSDQRAAARQAAGRMTADLTRVSGMLEEVATLWRRGDLHPPQSSPIAPGRLQDTARSLADALRVLPDADSKEHAALAFAAVAELAALEGNAARSAAVTADRRLGDAGLWAAVEGALLQVGEQLWILLCCLVKIGETCPAVDPTAAQDAAGASAGLAGLAAAGAMESRRALAAQRAAIDALPEPELRRLLVLIGGMDPEVLHRAAATYTETFSAVAAMESSVAALRPLALAGPGDDLPGRDRG